MRSSVQINPYVCVCMCVCVCVCARVRVCVCEGEYYSPWKSGVLHLSALPSQHRTCVCMCARTVCWHDLLHTGKTSTFSHKVIEFPEALAAVQTPGFTLCLPLSFALLPVFCCFWIFISSYYIFI